MRISCSRSTGASEARWTTPTMPHIPDSTPLDRDVPVVDAERAPFGAQAKTAQSPVLEPARPDAGWARRLALHRKQQADDAQRKGSKDPPNGDGRRLPLPELRREPAEDRPIATG